MELWIRSQNRENLIKSNDISYTKVNVGNLNYEHRIVGYYCDHETDYEILGTYKTKERALEVLDEIQRKITPVTIIKQTKPIKYIDYNRTISDATLYVEDISEVKEVGMIIYEMPLD